MDLHFPKIGKHPDISLEPSRGVSELLWVHWLVCFHSQCLPADTLAIYSMSEQTQLDGQRLTELCPTMLQQLDAGSCKLQKEVLLISDPPPRPTGAEGELRPVTLRLSVNCTYEHVCINSLSVLLRVCHCFSIWRSFLLFSFLPL